MFVRVAANTAHRLRAAFFSRRFVPAVIHTVFLNWLNPRFLCRMCWKADRQPGLGALDYFVRCHGSGWGPASPLAT
jgi:hypothetical protein